MTKDTSAAFYGEFDFQGAAQTANSNQSDSYNPRIRVLYGQIDWNASGWHLLGGQNWSLLTLQNNGITPRSEVTPPQIDAQYIPGFAWARQPGFRIVKDFNKEWWLGLSVENPQTTLSNTNGIGSAQTGGLLAGVTQTANQAPTNGYFNGTNYSLNSAPDVIGKVAWEKKVGDQKVHVEGFGIYRSFTARVNFNAAAATALGGTAGNYTANSTGGGGGGSISIYDVIPKHLDLQASFFAGNGIGRYGSGGLPDVTSRQDGTLVGIPETMWLAGGTFHANKGLGFLRLRRFGRRARQEVRDQLDHRGRLRRRPRGQQRGLLGGRRRLLAAHQDPRPVHRRLLVEVLPRLLRPRPVRRPVLLHRAQGLRRRGRRGAQGHREHALHQLPLLSVLNPDRSALLANAGGPSAGVLLWRRLLWRFGR
ncbi:MAG: hypothetical protein WDN45_18865 [Caulobacteraceae bacterium]